jgi:PAS domain-containing protein
MRTDAVGSHQTYSLSSISDVYYRRGIHESLQQGRASNPGEHTPLRCRSSERYKLMAKEALLYNDQLFRALIEHSPDAIILIAPDGTITYASPSIAHITGYAPEEIVGMNSFALLHPDDQGCSKEQLTTLIEHAQENLTL